MTTDPAALAARLHAGQVDKQGQPYLDHLTAVVTILRERWPEAPRDVVAAAWLHDVIEDTGATADELRWEGIPAETIRLVEMLTKPEGSAYLNWIEALAASGDLWAIRIKLADNAHNSEPGRAMPALVAKRYAPARAVLEIAEASL